MRHHIDVVARCFAVLRQLRAIRQYVSPAVLQTLVTTLLLTRSDCGNAVLYGLPAVQLRRLQSVQNAAARLIFGLRRTAHITDALICLHWLRVPERILFKLAVLTYRALHGSAPQYLCTFLPVSGLPGDAVCAQPTVRNWLYLVLVCQQSATARFRWLVPAFGTVSRRTSPHPRRSTFSVLVLRHICLASHFLV